MSGEGEQKAFIGDTLQLVLLIAGHLGTANLKGERNVISGIRGEAGIGEQK